jgi:hypothetical protein
VVTPRACSSAPEICTMLDGASICFCSTRLVVTVIAVSNRGGCSAAWVWGFCEAGAPWEGCAAAIDAQARMTNVARGTPFRTMELDMRISMCLNRQAGRRKPPAGPDSGPRVHVY